MPVETYRVETYQEAQDILFRACGRCPEAPAPTGEELLGAARFFIETSAMRRSSRRLAYRDIADGLLLAAMASWLEDKPRVEEFGTDEIMRDAEFVLAAAERTAARLAAKVGGK